MKRRTRENVIGGLKVFTAAGAPIAGWVAVHFGADSLYAALAAGSIAAGATLLAWFSRDPREELK